MGDAMMARTFFIVFGIVLLLGNESNPVVALSWYSRTHKSIVHDDEPGTGFGPDFNGVELNFGVGTIGGEMSMLIPRMAFIPIQRSKVFTTTRDQQTSLTIQVFEGVSKLTNNCLFLGEFNLTGIPPAPRGAPQIKITFIVDFNLTLIVEAEDEANRISEKLTIPYNNYTVWNSDVEQMIDEEKSGVVGSHSLKTYADDHIFNDKLDRLMKEMETWSDHDVFDNDEYILEVMDEMRARKESRWRFKNKPSTSENQIAENESIM